LPSEIAEKSVRYYALSGASEQKPEEITPFLDSTYLPSFQVGGKLFMFYVH